MRPDSFIYLVEIKWSYNNFFPTDLICEFENVGPLVGSLIWVILLAFLFMLSAYLVHNDWEAQPIRDLLGLQLAMVILEKNQSGQFAQLFCFMWNWQFVLWECIHLIVNRHVTVREGSAIWWPAAAKISLALEDGLERTATKVIYTRTVIFIHCFGKHHLAELSIKQIF